MITSDTYENEQVTVKAESNFYSVLEECPNRAFMETRGAARYRKGGGSYLTITKEIIDPGSLFYRYLMTEKCREVFGTRNPLYPNATLAYESELLTGIHYFSTRLLLAFMEVQLALGFSGSLYDSYKAALESRMRGSAVPLTTNYYHPSRTRIMPAFITFWIRMANSATPPMIGNTLCVIWKVRSGLLSEFHLRILGRRRKDWRARSRNITTSFPSPISRRA
jgi:hypothetical protein